MILLKLREIHRIKLMFIQVDDLGLPVLNAANVFMRMHHKYLTN